MNIVALLSPANVIAAVTAITCFVTLMSIITEFYTSIGKRPVNTIVRQSGTGHATNVIGGLAVGMESTLLPIIVLAGGIYGSYALAGLYGVAIAAAGMMATTAMQLAIDAFGPIADNAGGIAEMSELPKEVREKTDTLDAVGNTTAATGKGFAIASAALTALAPLGIDLIGQGEGLCSHRSQSDGVRRHRPTEHRILPTGGDRNHRRGRPDAGRPGLPADGSG